MRTQLNATLLLDYEELLTLEDAREHMARIDNMKQDNIGWIRIESAQMLSRHLAEAVRRLEGTTNAKEETT